MSDEKKDTSAYSAIGRREKAEALDVFVKQAIAKARSEQLAKTAKLRALRLAKDVDPGSAKD